MTEITQLDEPVIIQAVQFFETYCEILFAQAIDIDMATGEMISGRATVLYENLKEEEIGEMLETLREWVDGTYRRLRRGD